MTEFPPRERSAYPHFSTMTTRWRDNDVYAHMNNVVYYEYFDTVVNQWLIESEALELPHGPIVGLVVETACRFHASVGFPAKLDIGMGTLKVGGSSVVYGVGIFLHDEGTAAAVGRFAHVYVDSAARRPTPLPKGFRDRLQALGRIASE